MSTERNDDAAHTFPHRQIDTTLVTYQALASVMDGMNDAEAAQRLNTLSIKELRDFQFQLDRMRAITHNLRKDKMSLADQEAKRDHEARIIREDAEVEADPNAGDFPI